MNQLLVMQAGSKGCPIVESCNGTDDALALDRVQPHQDDEELRMLASLKREHEAEESAVALSDSQIHQCHVSLSVSSDDTSTWTHNSMPDHQGHHYQKEMKPLLSSNPRSFKKLLTIVFNSSLKVINEEEYLNLLYDPCLNCYFDPKSGKYYELA
uniref:Zgc:162324 n=1 Tax=Neogobius melanostomus TaxID=47308 RepID=A0A8C6V3N4_9GOBI